MHDALTTYLTRLDAYPPLDPVDVYALAVRARKGDRAARERLIQHHLRLVVSIAKRYLRHASDPMDLIQAGNLGLIEAVDRYDPDRGALSTFASYWVEKYVRLQAAQDGPELPLPPDLTSEPAEVTQEAPESPGPAQRFVADVLSTKERLIITLRHVDGHSLQRTGELVTPPLSRRAVKRIETKALLKLRAAAVQQKDYEHE